MVNKGTAVLFSLIMILSGFMMISWGDEVEGASATNIAQTIWDSEIAFEGTDPVDGLEMGEIYADKPGDEAVITSRDGGTYVVYYEDDQWKREKIWESPGQQLTPAIGDLLPDHDGNEILVVGLSSGSEDVDPGDGTATVLHREGGSWIAERAYTDSKLIHGCAIGDLDSNIPGVEAVVTTFNRTALMVWWDGDHWNNSLIFQDGHNVRKAVIADLTDEHEGNEVVCASKSGNATLSWGEAGNWTTIRIYQGDPLARISVGDVDPDPGLEIYAGSDTFKIIGIKYDGSEWVNQTLFTDTNKNRGVWTGDVDPAVDGNELYAFGYSRRLVQITGGFSTGWNVKDIYLDTARAHELRVGDLHPDVPGLEVGIVGYSQNLTVVFPSKWVYDLPFIGSDPVDGVEIGDLYPDKEGNEGVIVARDGGTYIVYWEDEQWKKEKIWQTPGQQLTPAIGDLLPEYPGNEILVVGLSSGSEDVNPGDGTATVLHREGGSWIAERAYTDTKLIHGCAIGDLDPTVDGLEAVLTTFNRTAVMIWYDGSAWQNDLIYTADHNVRKAVITDLVDSHEGNEVVCVDKAGNATIAYGSMGNWTTEVAYSGDPIARVAVGNVDPDPELEIYLGTDTFKVIGLQQTETGWVDTVLFHDSNKNRGVWTGDVDPDVPGQELYAFGYSRRLVQITDPFGTGRKVTDIFLDTARAHELRVGDLMPDKDGKEIAIVGYSQNLTVISLREEGELAPPTLTGDDTLTVASGETSTADLSVAGDGYMTVEVSGMDGAEVSVYPETAFIKADLKLTVKAEHVSSDMSGDVTVTLKQLEETVTKTVTVSITGDTSAPSVESASISVGDQIAWDDPIELVMSEPVAENSFTSAVDGGDISLMVAEQTQDADFSLSDDGTTITVTLMEQVARGEATLTVSGLTDRAGNEMETYSLNLEIQQDGGGDDDTDDDDDTGDDDTGDDDDTEDDEEEDEDPGQAWLIILVVAVLAVVLLIVIVGVVMGKKKDEEEESPDLPDE